MIYRLELQDEWVAKGHNVSPVLTTPNNEQHKEEIEMVYCAGCLNVSHYDPQQSFLELLSFRQSHHMIKLYFTVKFWEDTERLKTFEMYLLENDFVNFCLFVSSEIIIS